MEGYWLCAEVIILVVGNFDGVCFSELIYLSIFGEEF
jgi:hypothetical protein